jgi:hypothetical protein
MPVYEDPAERIERLLDTAEPELRTAFLGMVAQIRSSLTLEAVADAIERGELEKALEAALRAVPMLGEAYVDQFIAAARDTARELGVALGEVSVVFDQTNVGAVNAMNENKLRLIRGFSEDQRATTRNVLARAIGEGTNPIEAARSLRNSIGLTPRQAQAVANYRRALETLDRDALQRLLRDKRFDRTVAAAIADNKPLTRAQVDKLVERYSERMLKHRAEVIARTEALRSVHQGAEEMYRQAIASGDLRPDMLSREWNTARDERVRESHSAMHGQVQPFGSPFVSGNGNLLNYPGDPEAPAEETIQCRCAVGTRITTLAGLA